MQPWLDDSTGSQWLLIYKLVNSGDAEPGAYHTSPRTSPASHQSLSQKLYLVPPGSSFTNNFTFLMMYVGPHSMADCVLYHKQRPTDMMKG